MVGIRGEHSIAKFFRKYLYKKYNIKHIYGNPMQTQEKVERYHRSMKNAIKLNHYFCPSEQEEAIDRWVKYYNEKIFHESLDNLTPKDIYLGQGEKIKKIRNLIKQNSINKRFLIIKQENIRVNNYIRSCTLLLDNIQSVKESM